MLTGIEFIALTRLALSASNGELPEDLDQEQMEAIFAKLCPVTFKLDQVFTHVSFMPSTNPRRPVTAGLDWVEFPFGEVEGV